MGPAIALVLALGVAVGGVMTMALRALSEADGRRDAEKRAAEQKGRGDLLDCNLTSLAAQLADITVLHREEKERADRLADAHAKMVAQIAQRGSAGSYNFLLSLIAEAQTAPGGEGPRSLPQPASTDAGLGTELLRPGD